jgi:hypothetical protein
MRKTFIAVVLLHILVLVIGRYFYVIRPILKEIIKPIIIKEKPKEVVKKVKRIPPKPIKKTPTPMQPLKRRLDASLELIAVKRGASIPDFVVVVPEYGGGRVYRPDVSLVHLPEPPIKEAPVKLFERELKIKEREVVLESFALTELPPVGSVENPVAQLIIDVYKIGAPAFDHQFGIYYPENKLILDGPKYYTHWQGSLGPYVVRLEDVIFYYYVIGRGGEYEGRTWTYLSTDRSHCYVDRLGPNRYRYTWEDLPNNTIIGPDRSIDPAGGIDTPDLQFVVTFVGALEAR